MSYGCDHLTKTKIWKKKKKWECETTYLETFACWINQSRLIEHFYNGISNKNAGSTPVSMYRVLYYIINITIIIFNFKNERG